MKFKVDDLWQATKGTAGLLFHSLVSYFAMSLVVTLGMWVGGVPGLLLGAGLVGITGYSMWQFISEDLKKMKKARSFVEGLAEKSKPREKQKVKQQEPKRPTYTYTIAPNANDILSGRAVKTKTLKDKVQSLSQKVLPKKEPKKTEYVFTQKPIVVKGKDSR